MTGTDDSAPDAGPASAQVVISGRVQGVGYRAWTRRTALDLGLSGWVWNRPDGRVEAYFQGDPGAITTMIERCKAGPAGASVDGVMTLEATAEAYEGFEIRRTPRS
jgi:acylphosphatase